MHKQLFSNKRLQSILFLGAASGLPLALTSSSLQAWFTQSGTNLMVIGFLSLLGLPYVWKFLWAPFLDRFIPPLLGRRRGWIAGMQALLCVLLFSIAQLQPTLHASWIGLIALIIAFGSATQDIADDAYRTDILLPDERGLGAALFTLGYRMAMLVSGGLALVMADVWGWKLTYEFMAFLMLIATFVTFFMPKEPVCQIEKISFFQFFLAPFKELLSRKRIAYLLIFIVLYKLGDALALSLMSNFLLGTLQFTLTEVGIAFKTFGLVATLLGVFVGGLFLVRINVLHALIGFGLLQALSNALFILLAIMGKNYILMVTCIFTEAFCSGMSTAAFVAFLMSLCHRNYTATQYAFLSALFGLTRVAAGPASAWLVQSVGWINLYWIAFLLSFPGIIVLLALRKNVGLQHAEAVV